MDEMQQTMFADNHSVPRLSLPNHYLALGLPVFEADPTAIERAAEERLTELAACHVARARRCTGYMLARIAAAKRRLLNPLHKADYDTALARELDEMMAAEFVPEDEPPPDLALESLMEIINAAPDPEKRFQGKKDRKCRFSPLLSLASVGLNAVAAIAVWTVASGDRQPQRAAAVSVQRNALEKPITSGVPPADQIPDHKMAEPAGSGPTVPPQGPSRDKGPADGGKHKP